MAHATKKPGGAGLSVVLRSAVVTPQLRPRATHYGTLRGTTANPLRIVQAVKVNGGGLQVLLSKCLNHEMQTSDHEMQKSEP